MRTVERSACAATRSALSLSTVVILTGASTGPFAMAPASGDVSTGAILAGTVLTTLIFVLIGGATAIFTSQLTLTAYADLRARVEPLTTSVLVGEIGLQPPATATEASPAG